MTAHQRAQSLLDQFSEEGVEILIPVMIRMLAYEEQSTDTPKAAEDSQSPKMKAFLRMQELRKETAQYDITESQRAAALNEKYGAVV